MDGYNVTLIAYGQTGSGKTYTMIGTENNPVIAPRAFGRLFELLKEVRNRHEVQKASEMIEEKFARINRFANLKDEIYSTFVKISSCVLRCNDCVPFEV